MSEPIKKVIINNQPIIDLTDTDLHPYNAQNNLYFYNSRGEKVEGTGGNIGDGAIVPGNFYSNGEYFADEEGFLAYSSVKINVPEGISSENLLTLTVGTEQLSQEETKIFNPEIGKYYKEVIVEPISTDYIIPKDNIEITQNGANIDVKNFATASVNVIDDSCILKSKEVTLNEEQLIIKALDDECNGYDEVTITMGEDYFKPEGKLNITTNGEHVVTEYSEVSVSVQPNLNSKTITRPGTYKAENEGLDGYDEVTVTGTIIKEISNSELMRSLLSSENEGNIYKFTGTDNGEFSTNAYYMVINLEMEG